MERSGASAPAVAPGELVELAGRQGPFLSVYLTTEVAVENAAQLPDRRWRSLRRQLADDGAPEPTLAVLDDLVPDAHLEGSALGAVIGGRDARGRGARDGSGRASFVDHDGHPLARDLAVWGDAPVLTPAIAWRQHQPPYVAALVDRTGADLVAVSRDRPPDEESAGDARWPISKPRGGGRARWRYEHRVEENWARNARQVAAELERLVDAVGARVVAVGGDERVIGILRDTLDDELGDLVVTVPGARAAEGAKDGLGDEVERWVHTVESQDTVAALDALRSRRAAGRAVTRAEETFAALRESRVDVLLVHDARLTPLGGSSDDVGDAATPGSPGSPRAPRAWFDPTTPDLCASTRAELVDLGVERPVDAPLVDVAVRATLLSGAGVRLVPAHGGPEGGIGALLRWSA